MHPSLAENVILATLATVPAPLLILANTDTNYMVVFGNSMSKELLHTDDELYTGKPLDTLFAAAGNPWQDEINNCIEQAVKTGTVTWLKGVPYQRDTETTCITLYLDLAFSYTDGYVLVAITDITDTIAARQKTEQMAAALARNVQFTDDTQTTADSGTWEVDLSNNIVTWSDMLRRLHEVEDDFKPTFESSLAFYRHTSDREAMVTLVTEAMNTNEVFSIELEILSAKGNIKWLRCTGKADNTKDTGARVYGTAQDITARKAAEIALTESHNRYEALLDTIEGIVWEADAQTFDFTFVSNKVYKILGYTPQQWLNRPGFWLEHIYPADRDYALNFCKLQTEEAKDHVFDYRMVKANGDIAWIKDMVSVVLENGRPRWLRGIMMDITETRILADLDHLEKEVLELNYHGDISTATIMDTYVRGLEKLFPNMICSVLGVKDNKVFDWASPSLPAEYTDALNTREIGPLEGSCGSAAYFKERIIVSDITVDDKWVNYRDIALKYGLRSCWSFPVMDADNNVIAVFGVYYTTVKTPGDNELAIVERSATILKMLLENRLFGEMMVEMNSLITQGQQLANFGNWQWDIQNNKVSWSETLYDIYGLDKHTSPSTFEGYLGVLHADDKERVQTIITNTLKQQNDVVFEERIVRPDGSIRHLRSWGRVIADKQGAPVKMIGACLDITAAKTTESKMEEIAWLQSHVIRAPLARLMGLVNVLQNELVPGSKQDELVSHILQSADELDKVIRMISKKTN